jgi:hypothetical protein
LTDAEGTLQIRQACQPLREMGVEAEMTSRRRALVVGGVACLTALSAITLLAATRGQARAELLGSRRGVFLSGAALPPHSLGYAPVPPGHDEPQFDTSEAESDMDAVLAVAEQRIKSMYAGIASQRLQFQEEERIFAAEKSSFEEEEERTGIENEAEAERLIAAAKELSEFDARITAEAADLEAKQASFRAAQEEASLNRETEEDAPVDQEVAAAGAAAADQKAPAIASAVMTRGERVLQHLRSSGLWPSGKAGAHKQHGAAGVSPVLAASVKQAVAGAVVKHRAAAAGTATVVAKPAAKVAPHPRRPGSKAVAGAAGKGAKKATPWFNWTGFGVKLQASWQPGHQAWYANLDDDQSAASRGRPSVLVAFGVAAAVALLGAAL